MFRISSEFLNNKSKFLKYKHFCADVAYVLIILKKKVDLHAHVKLILKLYMRYERRINDLILFAS